MINADLTYFHAYLRLILLFLFDANTKRSETSMDPEQTWGLSNILVLRFIREKVILGF